ncbi:hypothetical protein N665_0441s0020 [Sinapis alba]|nr:hypothetical protein N665_0441s0020 [Sinapis alba]
MFHIIIIWMFFVIPSLVLSADDELHRLCSQPFSCGNQRGLLYPFWISGREDCGHPEFKVDCSRGFAELSISSVKLRILEANYDSGIIRLARSDYIGDLCPKDPLNAQFNQSVLPYVPTTELLTIYDDCSQDFSQYVPTYFGSFACGGDISLYYVTRDLSSPLLQRIRGPLEDVREHCNRSVSIPTSVPALNALQNDPTEDNLKKALEEGFELQLNQNCSTCLSFGGACGFNASSSGFVCYCIDGLLKHTCRFRNRNFKGISFRTKIGLGAGIIMIMLLVFGLFLQVVRKRKRETSHHLSQQNLKALIPQENLQSTLNKQPDLKALIPLKEYSYANVERITNSFAEVVGKGGFGTVYRGTLGDGRSVAVKVLKDSKDNNGEDFINEVASMSQTSHVNIVTLLGFCSEGPNKAILYEFMENGSLDKLITSMRSSNMDWTALFRIALGVARGLEYLHHGCRTRIVHFDIKPHNVLLDNDLCPKVSDFGLAKLCERKESMLSLLDTRGTIGYIAPEVFSKVYGRVSHKSDVYSYGMLVLEMIGARIKTDDTSSSTSSMYFPDWIYKDLEKGNNQNLDENGINSEEVDIAKKMTLVGLWCIQSWPSNRPPMNRVVEMMEGNLNALELPPKPVLQTPQLLLQESSMISEDISVNAEIYSMNEA